MHKAIYVVTVVKYTKGAQYHAKVKFPLEQTTKAQMGVGGQRHAPAVLPPGNTGYPLYRRLGGPQGRSGRIQKISPTP